MARSYRGSAKYASPCSFKLRLQCVCVVGESGQCTHHICLSRSAAHEIYLSWLQSLSSDYSTRSDIIADNV